jgi:membrane protein
VYADKLGSEIQPYHNAVKVQLVEVEKEPDTGKTTITNTQARHEEPVSVNVKST